MYNTYRYIFIGGLVLSLVFLAVTVFMFFFLNIKNAIGDITGSNKRKAMDKVARGKSSAMKKSASSAKSKPVKTSDSQATSQLSIQERYDAMEGSQHTTTLNLEKKNRINTAQKQAKPVVQPTTQSSGQRRQSPNAYQPIVIKNPNFVIEEDISFVHSNEVIV